MVIKHSLAVGILCALAAAAPLTSGAASTHGLSPELQQRLATATKFTCDGGAQTLAVARVNDNYCDCADGSDEPGTAACSHTDAKFYCANAGYFPKNIPTSRVNDHVCDCCDDSDEYGSGTACPITCASLMATFESEKRELLDEFEKGFSARQQLVTSAKEFFEQDTKQLATLESELATLKQSVSHMEKVKEAEELAETKERMDKAKETKKAMLSKLGLDELTNEQLGFLVLELANANYNKDEVLRFIKAERGDQVGESALEKEEAAWKMRDDERQKETERVNALIEERRKAKLEKEKDREEAIERGETPEETKEEEEEESEPERPPVEDRPVYSLFNQMHSFSSYERPQAKTARDSYNDANSKMYSTERTLKELKEGLEKAYGPDNVLYALKDKCFETSGGQYKYSMCFFGKAKQDHTSLGEMQDFDADKEELLFSGGATCWNGPARSLRVSLECGVEPELYGVDEPSTCVYTAKFKTPLVCDESYKSRLVAVDGESSDATPHHIEVAVEATM